MLQGSPVRAWPLVSDQDEPLVDRAESLTGGSQPAYSVFQPGLSDMLWPLST